MARITVIFFSYVADRMKARTREFTVPAATSVNAFFDQVLAPTLREPIHHFLFSVNAEWVDPGYELQDGDQLAVIPPVSGG
ncbi:MAG: MoaD/ThiS family protein [Firmicutes bacterium]|nr:MoaD/ThiS family protein [Bacillota bacterium]